MKRTVAVVVLSAILAVLSIVLGRSARTSRGASSIGYVSMQRIINESPRDKAGAARFQELTQQLREAMTKRNESKEQIIKKRLAELVGNEDDLGF